MRAGLFIALGASLLVLAACVPDFVFRDGAEATSSGEGGAGDDGSSSSGDGGRRRGEGGDGGGNQRPSVGIGVGPSSAQSTSAVGTSSSASVTSVTSTVQSAATTTGPIASSSGDTTGSSGSGGTPGVPCWDGDAGQDVVCQGSKSACCADTSDYDYDECGFPGDCGGFAWELACNENADCGGRQCCIYTDGFGGLDSIECASSCSEYVACDPAAGCEGGGSCSPIFEHDPDHPEYDAYGVCN